MEFDNTFEDPLPLSNNHSKVEFSESDFCIDPRDYLHDLQPFDYDGHRFYLVGSSFSPDLSIPLHCFDPFDPMASENFSTDLSPFLEQNVENAINFVNFYDERSYDMMSAGNGCYKGASEKSFKGKKSRPTKQLWSAKDRLLTQHGNNGTWEGKRAYHLRSYTKRQKKETWMEEGEKIIPHWDATNRSQFLGLSSSLLDDYIQNLN